MMRTLLVLGRVSNLPTVWTNCLAGWVLVGGAWSIELVYLMVGGSLSYIGGMFLNDACDVSFDRVRCPERPIPSGAISRRSVSVLAALLLVGGGLVLILPGGAGWEWVVALTLAIVLYDVVHKRWAGAVLIMGACRFLLYGLAGFAALQGKYVAAMPDRIWLAAAGLFFYVVGITVAARGESTGGSVSGWAWLLLVSPVVAWLVAGGGGLGILMVGIFGGWLWRCALHLRGESPGRVGRYVSGLLAGIVIVDSMMASMGDWKVAMLCLVFFPLTLVLQRYVPAT